MKRKLLVAGAVLVALFVGMVLVVGLMKSSPSARVYKKVTAVHMVQYCQ